MADPGRPAAFATRYRLLIVVLLALALVVYLLGNGLMPLVDRDEPRYAQASKQMLESGDWITPRYLDALRLKKPVFIYWLQATSMKVFGATDFAARLPSVIASVLTLLMFALAWPRIVGRRRALWSVFIFATMLMPAYLAKVCMTDAVLHLFIAAAMLCLYWICAGWSTWRTFVPLGVALGGSLLTKGPPAFLFLGSTLLALWLLGFTTRGQPDVSARANDTKWTPILLGSIVALFIAVGLCVPWILKLEAAYPGALSRMFFDEVVKRGAEAQEGHSGPPGFYFVTFWGTAFPWCLFWPAAFWHAWKRRHTFWVRFCLAAILGPWVCLEIYRTKLPHYWLPSYPFFALLIADALVRALRGEIRDFGDKPFLIASAFTAVIVSAVGASFLWLPRLGDVATGISPLAAIVICFGIVSAAWGVFFLLRRGELQRAAVAMGLSLWTILVFAWTVLAPATPSLNLTKRVASELKALGATERIRMIDFKEPSLAFYQGGTIREQSEQVLPDPSAPDAPDWIVISDEIHRTQSASLREAYPIIRSFRGINVADGKLQETVHVLQRSSAPTPRDQP